MVKFYAYYSFGGYREFYLGNSQDTFTHSWYFSMLPIWEARLRESEDEALRARIEEARNLPQIEDVGKGGENAIPKEASSLVSHGGYDVIYKTAGEHQVLAVKDIDSRDDSGRPAPFMMLFEANNGEGIALLDKLAEYLLTELKTFKGKLSELFVYDLDKNGLRFDVQLMNAILAEVNGLATSPQVAWHKHYPVHIIITAQKLDITLQNQNLSRADVFFASDLNGNVLLEREQDVNDGAKRVDNPGTPPEEKEPEQKSEIHPQPPLDSREVVPVNVTKDQSFCEKASRCARSAKKRWNGLPNTVRYCIIAAAAILLLVAITPRSCKKGNDKKSNQTSQVLRYEKAL